MQETCHFGRGVSTGPVQEGPSSIDAPTRRPEGIAEVIEPIEGDLRRLEDFLVSQVDAFEPEVRPLVAYTLRHSGKKIRPILVFYGGRQESGPASNELVRAAAVVELVHLATLVHDDILDAADMRHRMPTVSAKHGADIAVLLGDALFAHALKLASDFPTVEVCRSVAEATRQVCSGEVAQTFARGEARLELTSYYRMIDLKTAELFAVSARLGAFLGDGSPEFVAAVSDFARGLGVAYQIYDDVADFLSRQERAGKTLGTDLASGKFTLPVLLFLEGLDGKEAEHWSGRLRAGEVPLGELREAMLAAGVFTAVAAEFNRRLERARAQLAPFGGKPAVPPLLGLADYVGNAMGKFALAFPR